MFGDTDDQDFIDYYEELYGEETEFDEKNLDEFIKLEKTDPEWLEHVLPVIQEIEGEPKDKVRVIKISNIPRKANQTLLLNMLKRNIKEFKYDKIVIEQDKYFNLNKGHAFISTNDFSSVKGLLRLHSKVSVSRSMIDVRCSGVCPLQAEDAFDGLPVPVGGRVGVAAASCGREEVPEDEFTEGG